MKLTITSAQYVQIAGKQDVTVSIKAVIDGVNVNFYATPRQPSLRRNHAQVAAGTLTIQDAD